MIGFRLIKAMVYGYLTAIAGLDECVDYMGMTDNFGSKSVTSVAERFVIHAAQSAKYNLN